MKTGKNGAQSLVAYAADVLQRRPFDPAAPLKSIFMLNTTHQKERLLNLLAILGTMDSCDSLAEIDPAYYGTRKSELEQQYRDELQHLLNSLACEPLAVEDAVQELTEHRLTRYEYEWLKMGDFRNEHPRSDAMFDPVANRDGITNAEIEGEKAYLRERAATSVHARLGDGLGML